MARGRPAPRRQPRRRASECSRPDTITDRSPPDDLEAAVGFVNGNIATLVPVAVLVFGAASLGDLIDDGSMVYLWLRPVPTWLHVVAAWAATVTVAVPLVVVPVVASAALIDASVEVLVILLGFQDRGHVTRRGQGHTGRVLGQGSIF